MISSDVTKKVVLSNISNGAILRAQSPNIPARRILQMNALHGKPCCILSIEQDRPKIRIISSQNLAALKLIPPPLTITVQSSSALDLDVLASPLPEHDAVLEGMMEGVLLPVLSVIGELDLSVQSDMDVVEERQVERLTNDICVALGKPQCAAVHGLLESFEEFI